MCNVTTQLYTSQDRRTSESVTGHQHSVQASGLCCVLYHSHAHDDTDNTQISPRSVTKHVFDGGGDSGGLTVLYKISDFLMKYTNMVRGRQYSIDACGCIL